jgi:hypothetical protein
LQVTDPCGGTLHEVWRNTGMALYERQMRLVAFKVPEEPDADELELDAPFEQLATQHSSAMANTARMAWGGWTAPTFRPLAEIDPGPNAGTAPKSIMTGRVSQRLH